MRAEAAAPEDAAIGQHQGGGGARRACRFPAAGGASLPSARPVAAIMAGQWREGMALALRHLRTASVETPVRAAAASAPPRRSISSAMEIDMDMMLPEFFSGFNDDFVECRKFFPA